MKRMPWTSWKFWNRSPALGGRRVHLGIDYGTSASKIVFRDSSAERAESAVLVLRNGSFRIPSRVCITATELLFGSDRKASQDCEIYENTKMRVVAEISGNLTNDHCPTTLPEGFSAADLAALTVWFLISEGHRAVAANFEGCTEGVEIAMSMGVPMVVFNDKHLKAVFLSVARRAWSFYCHEGLVDSALLIEKARRLLERHPVAALSAIPEHEVQDWIRCEGEAAIWVVAFSLYRCRSLCKGRYRCRSDSCKLFSHIWQGANSKEEFGAFRRSRGPRRHECRGSCTSQMRSIEQRPFSFSGTTRAVHSADECEGP